MPSMTLQVPKVFGFERKDQTGNGCSIYWGLAPQTMNAKATFLKLFFSHVNRSRPPELAFSSAKLLLLTLLIHVKTFNLHSLSPSEEVDMDRT